MIKIKYVAATPDKKNFYKVTEWESDMTGYGGSISMQYEYCLVSNIDEATLFNSDPTPIMQRYNQKYWKPFVVLKIKELTIREIVNES